RCHPTPDGTELVGGRFRCAALAESRATRIVHVLIRVVIPHKKNQPRRFIGWIRRRSCVRDLLNGPSALEWRRLRLSVRPGCHSEHDRETDADKADCSAHRILLGLETDSEEATV